MQITSETAQKYRMEFVGRKDLAELNRVWALSAQRRGEARLGWMDEIKTAGQSIGIGDVVIPTNGTFAGVPLKVRGFTCTHIEPVFGLPAGETRALIVTTFYKYQALTTGLEIYLPTEEL